MSRKTTDELNEARRQKRQEQQRVQTAREARITSLRTRLVYLRQNRKRSDQLKSVLDGLYIEMDKLTKKAPADEVTELALKRVNDVIKHGKELMGGDEFIDSIDPFIAAGERPEHRDVLLVISELRQGVKRLQDELQQLSYQADREGWSIRDGAEEDSFG